MKMRVFRKSCIGIIVCSFLAALGAGDAEASNVDCKQRQVRDYGHVLRRLQLKSRGFPGSKGLPAAPGVGLYPLDADGILLSGEYVGYKLLPIQRGPSSLRSDVRLEAKLFRLLGHHAQLLAENAQNVTAPEIRAERRFRRRASRGFYRLDVRVRAADGRAVVYRKFFRVLPHRLALKMAINGTSFHVGQKLVGRLENLGTVDVLLPRSSVLNVERRESGGWVIVRSEKPDVIPEIEPEFLHRGRATGCTTIDISPTFTAGTYRLSILVTWPGRSTWRVLQKFTVDDGAA